MLFQVLANREERSVLAIAGYELSPIAQPAPALGRRLDPLHVASHDLSVTLPIAAVNSSGEQKSMWVVLRLPRLHARRLASSPSGSRQ